MVQFGGQTKFGLEGMIPPSVYCTPKRVIHPTPPPATLPGFQTLLFSHTRLETVGDRYVSGTSSSPNCPFLSFHCTFCFIQYLWRGSLRASTPRCRPALCIAKRLSLFLATMEEAMLFTLHKTVWKGQPSTGSHQCHLKPILHAS
jgi:hypothetical protein